MLGERDGGMGNGELGRGDDEANTLMVKMLFATSSKSIKYLITIQLLVAPKLQHAGMGYGNWNYGDRHVTNIL